MKAAIFDLDGTLLDSMDNWRNMIEELYQTLTLQLTKEDMEELEKISLRQKAEYIACNCMEGVTAEEVLNKAYDIMSEKYRKEVVPIKGAEEYLKKLYHQNIPMGIATLTNGKMATNALKNHGLLKYFNFVLSADEIGKGKREPDIFLEAARRLGCLPEDTMVFEDSLFAIHTANKAGFPICAVTGAASPQEKEEMEGLCRTCINDFSELL